MSVTVPTWIVALQIILAFIAVCLWVDRRFLRPGADRLAAKLVDRLFERRNRRKGGGSRG